MDYKVVAELKGKAYGSVKFAVNTKDLTKVVETLNSLCVIDDEFLLTEDGYTSAHYECGPISIKIETNVPFYEADEMNAMRMISKELEKKKKEEASDEAA